MNIVTTIDNYNTDCVFFSEPIKNTVISHSDFVRIIYSNDEVMLNGVYLYIYLSTINLEPYYNKYKCMFCKKQNAHIINQLEKIEKMILDKYKNTTKSPEYSIHNQIMNGYIKIFTSNLNKYKSNNNMQLILKISGLWENETNYGVTFKFIPIEN
jgi:hypothetical protein